MATTPHISPGRPALVLAPMEGITDAPMRDFMGRMGAFTFAVSEFLRVSEYPLPSKVFVREVPELANGSLTPNGLPVQVQLLGGNPERMAVSAAAAVRAGANAIDINFGCPAPTVNRNDGGASLLRHPERIRDIVTAIRQSIPSTIPVSAKLRLGWDDIGDIHRNAAMAIEGGASWLTIHARTRTQGYAPPVHWSILNEVRRSVPVSVVANGDIQSLDGFKRCREETGCIHFMIGRGALSNPVLPGLIAAYLGIGKSHEPRPWEVHLKDFLEVLNSHETATPGRCLARVKQWLSIASKFGDFPHFDLIKRSKSADELFMLLASAPSS